MVIVANQTFIELMGNRLVRFEKHHSLEGAEISLFTRLSIGKFINYGLIFLLNEDYFGIASSLLGLEYVAPLGFSLSWYNTVGPSVVLTNTFDIFGSHGMKAATYTISLLERWESYRDPLLALDQQSLNKIYLGMQFTLGSRYANLYSAFFIAMIFGPSIPLVTIFVAMNFFFTYWFEKYAFVNLYRVPPRYTTALGRWSTQLMPFAIAGRLIFSLWCLSDDRIFFNGSYGEFQALPEAEAGFNLIAFAGKGANFGLFFLLIGFATVWTCYELYDNPYFYYGRVAIDYVFWRIVKRYKEALEDAHGLGRTVTYAEAVATHKFKNLHSYNILHNPLYQEAFHITDELAASGHSRISDIKAYHTHRNEIHRSQTRSVDSGDGSGDTGNKPGSDGKKGRNFGSGSTSTEANKNPSSLASMEEDNRRRQRDEQERTKEMRAKIRMEAKAKEEKIKQQIISQGPASLTREQKEMLVILNDDLNEDENHLPRPPDNVLNSFSFSFHAFHFTARGRLLSSRTHYIHQKSN